MGGSEPDVFVSDFVFLGGVAMVSILGGLHYFGFGCCSGHVFLEHQNMGLPPAVIGPVPLDVSLYTWPPWSTRAVVPCAVVHNGVAFGGGRLSFFCLIGDGLLRVCGMDFGPLSVAGCMGVLTAKGRCFQ